MIDDGRRALESVAAASSDWTDTRALDERISGFEKLFPYSRGVFIIDAHGRPLAPASARNTDVRLDERQWFKKAVSAKGFVVGEFVVSRVTGAPVLPLGLPVMEGSSLVAVLVLSIDLSWLYDNAQNQGLPDGSTINFIGPDGSVLVRYPDPQDYVGRNFRNSTLVEVAAKARATSTVFESPGLDNVHRLYVVQPLTLESGFAGSVAVGIPLSQIHRSSSTALTVTWAVIVVVMAFAAAASVVGVRGLVLRPIGLLADHAQKLTSGDFGSRVEADRLPRELQLLAEAFNTTSESLEHREREVKKYREHLEELVADRTRELTRSQADLQRSNAELQQFAYVASHDLQEPLRMVASFTQLLAQKYEGGLDEQAQQYIGFAVDGATRMQQLINDLLAYSRIETQARSLQSVDSAACLQLALANLELRIRETGAQIDVGPLPSVVADQTQLSQVFQNLVGNGIKFNRTGSPRVAVSARTDGSMVEFTVEDNGIGISQEFSERVFVIFQRLNTRAEFPGTGIGLAVCRRIVDRHGGRIWFEAAPQGGTRFLFTLPAPQGVRS
jgi:signal transduction histidine kinase